MNRDGKNASLFYVIFISLVVASIPILALSIKNIISLGFEDFYSKISIYGMGFFFFFLVAFMCIFLATKLDQR